MSTTLLTTRTVRQIDDLSEPFMLCKPRNYPTATLSQFMKGKAPISEKVQWGEKSLLQRATQINNGAGYDDNDTAFTVDSTEGLQLGRHFMIYRTKEIIKCGSVDSGTGIGSGTACTRGARGTSPAAILDNDSLVFLNNPREENYSYSDVTPDMVLSDEAYNLLEIFVEHIGVSNTEQAIQARGGVPFKDDYETQAEEALERVKAYYNRELLLGIRSTENVGTVQKRRTFGGLIQYAYWQDYTAKDITDRTVFESTFKNVATWSDGDLMVPCSYYALQAHQYLYQGGASWVTAEDVVRVAGVEITKVRHFMGFWLNLYYEPALEDYYDQDNSRWLGCCGVYPKKNVKVHDNRPIGRYKVPPTTDGFTEGILLETAPSFKGAKSFAMFGGIIPPS